MRNDDEVKKLPTVYVGIESDSRGNESPEHQLKMIREHPAASADERFCIGEFAESGKSGFKAERGPELQAAIEKAKVAAAEHGGAELWVFHSSRLSRGDGSKGKRSLMKLWSDLLYEDVQVRSVEDDEFVVNPMLVGVASTQNNKYSVDLSGHVSRGKRAQWDRGRRLGGPVPDGYLADRTRDASGKIVSIDYSFDPARQPVLDRLFELVLSGTPDTSVSRSLNQEGFRTKTGKLWTRRRVQDTVTNPFYAGLIARNRSEPGALETRKNEGEHPGYITPEQLETLLAARSKRDKGKGHHRRVGAPTKAHLLDGGNDGLGGCLRCQGPISPRTSSYRRKSDGGRKRTYLCRHVHESTGTCDGHDIDAAVLDAALLDSLQGLFIDFEGWLDGIKADSDATADAIRADLERYREIHKKAERKEDTLARRYAEHVGSDETLAAADALAMKQQAELKEDAKGRITELEKALGRAEEPEPVDKALDLYNSLAASVKGALGHSRLGEVRDGLRETFEKFWIGINEDGDIEVVPQLRDDLVETLTLVQGEHGAHLSPRIMVEDEEGNWAGLTPGLANESWRNPTPIPVVVPAGNVSNSQE